MIKLMNFILLVSLVFTDESPNSKKPTFDFYKRLNENETRLQEYRDDDKALILKLNQLEVINASRKKHKAKPVALDILASRVANRMCREAAENGYISHWNMAGEKPYLRYAFAGGYDHIAENAFGEWTSGTYENTTAAISELMKSGHKSFMSERAPADGHKKNIINKVHNFIGIGYYVTDGQFRYYEEFIDRYLEFENIPAQVNAGQNTSITFRCSGSYYPYYILVYREDFPTPKRPEELNRTGSYSDYTNEEYLQLTAWEIARYKKGNDYKVPLSLKKEGLYYIQIFTDKKEITSPAAISTKGKSSCSGIVIKAVK